MVKNRWLKSKKTVLILILLCVFLTGTLVFCRKTALIGGENGDIEIHTEYCDLYYPSRWGENVKILQIEDTVQFRAEIDGYGLQPLFDIHFNSDDGIFCGMILSEDGREVSVSQTTYPIEQNVKWSQEQLEMLYGMQEDLNSLLLKLPIVVSENTKVQEELPAYGDIEIATPYGVLRYPDDWVHYLRLNEIEADVYTVEFYANVEHHPEQHLFDVRIGSLPEGGIELYEENGKIISLNVEFVLGELDQTWEEVDSDIIYGMMDDVNYLLNMLETMESNS